MPYKVVQLAIQGSLCEYFNARVRGTPAARHIDTITSRHGSKNPGVLDSTKTDIVYIIL